MVDTNYINIAGVIKINDIFIDKAGTVKFLGFCIDNKQKCCLSKLKSKLNKII